MHCCLQSIAGCAQRAAFGPCKTRGSHRDELRVVDGGWRMEDGGRRMADGKLDSAGHAVLSSTITNLHRCRTCRYLHTSQRPGHADALYFLGEL